MVNAKTLKRKIQRAALPAAQPKARDRGSRLLSIQRVAELLDVKHETIRQAILSGKLVAGVEYEAKAGASRKLVRWLDYEMYKKERARAAEDGD